MSAKGIQKVEFATTFNWATNSGTFSEILAADILAEGFSMGEIEEFLSRKANEQDELDGVRYTLTVHLRKNASVKPVDGAIVWFKVTPESGPAVYIGGVNGVQIRYALGGMRPLSQGQWFDRMMGTYAGANSGAVIKPAA